MGWSGEDWQKHVKLLLTRRYGPNLVLIPDRQGGDLGLEAFARDGCAFQCYAAEEPLGVADLTEKQRDKITRDVNKFVTNEDRLLEILGPTKIKNWILMVPRYDSRQILAHAEKKAAELRTRGLRHVGSEFFVLVHDEKLFPVELQELVKVGLARATIPSYVPTPEEIAVWQADRGNLASTIDAKLAKVPAFRDERARQAYTANVIGRYIAGENLLRHLRDGYPLLYEKIAEIKRSREAILEMEWPLETESPARTISTTAGDYRRRVAETVRGFTETTFDELAWEAIADWLARCPLDFPEAS